MPRRKPYTKVEKRNQIRADHVKGKGDVVFKGFQCLNPLCQEFIFVRKDSLGDVFEVTCPSCGTVLRSGEETKFYEYDLTDLRTDEIIEAGDFSILHDDYVQEAQEYKYCIICNTLKPLYLFDHHSARQSGRQGERRLCKAVYNAIKNQTRITDQHREAAQKRRMYLDLAGGGKIDSLAIFQRFDYRCFNCNKDLRNADNLSERPLDHTLPAVYLWPLTTANATLLCRDCNGAKSGRWPSAFYTDQQLRKLSVITGIDYEKLSGPPHFNPEAMSKLRDPNVVDQLLSKYAPYIDELIRLRNRILRAEGFDFFQHSRVISQSWIDRANAELSANSNR